MHPVDRRYVLKQGARFAYAAPVVVASVRLSEQRTAALSGVATEIECVPPCGPCELCSSTGCVPDPECTAAGR